MYLYSMLQSEMGTGFQGNIMNKMQMKTSNDCILVKKSPWHHGYMCLIPTDWLATTTLLSFIRLKTRWPCSYLQTNSSECEVDEEYYQIVPTLDLANTT